MNPSKLIRHLRSKRAELESKPTEFFERKLDELKGQQQLMQCANISEAALKASYLVLLHIPKTKKPFTIGEELIMPSVKNICQEVLGETAAKKVSCVPLSNNTVAQRIDDISQDMEDQLIDWLKNAKYFSLQFDESTGITGLAILLLLVNYIRAHALNSRLFACLDFEWLAKLAYLADMFSSLNDLNLSLQDKMTSVFQTADKVTAFKNKLQIWSNCVSKHCFNMFPVLLEALSDANEQVVNNLVDIIGQHLKFLSEKFEDYFPTERDPRNGQEWIRDPFISKTRASLSTMQEDQLIELSNDKGLKLQFQAGESLAAFWIKTRPEYPNFLFLI
ncbi:SCND3 protein, partial [Polyodon spathula]|nr:SCND3 protein [Polyodon spathula]